MATLVVGLGLTACSVDTSGLEELEDKLEEASEEMNEEIDNSQEEAEETMSTVMYQCPDNCENGPAYFDAGPCKSCGKEMVEI